MRTFIVVALLSGTVLLAGCVSDSVAPYAVSEEDNAHLRDLHSHFPDVAVKVSEVTYPAGRGNNIIDCRGGAQISTPTGKPYDLYIRNALVKELELAGMYSSKASLGLSVSLDKVDFSSFPHGQWTIAGTVTLTDGATYDVTTHLPFRTSFWGQPACDHSAAAFEPTVEKFVSAVFADPHFTAALASGTATQPSTSQ